MSLEDLTAAISTKEDIVLTNIPRLTNDRLAKEIKMAIECKADVFIGLGGFDDLLREFKLLKYAPRAAFLFTFLDISHFIASESFTQKGCADVATPNRPLE